MTDKIIALVDGSAYSASVCEHAAWAAKATGAPVEILHVLGRRESAAKSDLSGSIRLGARTALLEELSALDEQRARLVAHRGRAILEDAQAIVTEGGVDNVATRLRHGDLVETVAAQEDEASLILIGKRGEAWDHAREHLGSNIERVVRASHKPVIVASRAFRPIQKVLVAYDGGASAMKAVDHIARDPLFAGLKVHVVRVGAETTENTRSLIDAEAVLKAAGLETTTSLVSGTPDAVLGKMVEDEPFDMVVMGAYGHSRIRSLVIGSTTTEMIRACKVPVMLVR